jgi:hypothetical protein
VQYEVYVKATVEIIDGSLRIAGTLLLSLCENSESLRLKVGTALMLECKESGAMTPGMAADAPVVFVVPGGANVPGREFSLADVQRLSRRTVSPVRHSERRWATA